MSSSRAVHDVESAVFKGTALDRGVTLSDAQELARQCAVANVTFAILDVGQPVGVCDWASRTISLSPTAMSVGTVLHELAHLATRDAGGQMSHLRLWQDLFVKMVSTVDRAVSETLRARLLTVDYPVAV